MVSPLLGLQKCGPNMSVQHLAQLLKQCTSARPTGITCCLPPWWCATNLISQWWISIHAVIWWKYMMETWGVTKYSSITFYNDFILVIFCGTNATKMHFSNISAMLSGVIRMVDCPSVCLSVCHIKCKISTQISRITTMCSVSLYAKARFDAYHDGILLTADVLNTTSLSHTIWCTAFWSCAPQPLWAWDCLDAFGLPGWPDCFKIWLGSSLKLTTPWSVTGSAWRLLGWSWKSSCPICRRRRLNGIWHKYISIDRSHVIVTMQ